MGVSSPRWKAREGQEVCVIPEKIPEHVMRYLAKDTLAACKRFYADPKNREAFEKWEAEQEAAKGRR